MRKKIKPILNLCLMLLIVQSMQAQTITWTDTTASYHLPDGIKLYFGHRESPVLRTWYLEVDTKVQDIALVPYLSKHGTQTISSFAAEVGAFAAINGGYFGGNSSYSTLIQPGEVLAQNIPSLTRNGKQFPVIRSMFSVREDRSMSVDWIYHFSGAINDVYKFEKPFQYNQSSEPFSPPKPDSGEVFKDLFLGLGGGPVLVKDGEVVNSYYEEIFWGSGVENTEPQPRTAVGFTENGKAILLVADGRATNTRGFSLPELAQTMIDLGCVEAINLDGGGSSQMIAGNQTPVNSVVDQRALVTFLAVVPQDSIPKAKAPKEFDQIVDTGDSDKMSINGNWFETSNAGFYGGTKSLIILAGDGTSTVTFKPNLPTEDRYEVYAWWVAASNRSTATPYIVYHKNGVDTVRQNQTLNHSKWVKIGDYEFSGNSKDSVTVSNMVNQSNVYVVADAIRFAKMEITSTVEDVKNLNEFANEIKIFGNYPNPFNPTTAIKYSIAQSGFVEMQIYNSIGERVSEVLMGNQMSGTHQFVFDGTGLSSGIYFYQIIQNGVNGTFKVTGKMTLIK